jgi:chromosome segregation ATPase
MVVAFDRTCRVMTLMDSSRRNMPMKTACWMMAVALFAVGWVQAQGGATVEERGRSLQQGQYRAGAAHRQLEQARHDAKLAEQDVLNLRDAHAAAQKLADQRKRELEAAQKTLAAAKSRLSAAQQAYDKEVAAVDAAHRGGAK